VGSCVPRVAGLALAGPVAMERGLIEVLWPLLPAAARVCRGTLVAGSLELAVMLFKWMFVAGRALAG
jgi:hypothetical protein